MNEKQELRSQFTLGHVTLVLTCIFVLLGLVIMKNGFRLRPYQTASAKQYTYAMAIADAQKEILPIETPQANQTANQLAMIDPTFSTGSVLGASTGTDDSMFPKAEDVLTPKILAPIKMRELNYSDRNSIQKYASDIQLIELQNNIDGVLANLTSEDIGTLKSIPGELQNVVSDLLLVDVPNELSEYHKIKMIYYIELSTLAQSYAGVKNVPDAKDIGVQVFSLTDRMQRIKIEILNKWGIEI